MDAQLVPGGLIGAGLLLVAVAFASWLATRRLVRVLRRREVLDHPNVRSSHTAPTPRGGGIAVIGIALPLVIAAYAIGAPGDAMAWAVIAGTALLALVSWRDDLRSLPVAVRLGAHAVAAAAALAVMPSEFRVFQGLLPFALDRLVAGLAWVWFINLYNFMDGIDGLAGVETVSICAGTVAVMAAVGGSAGAASMPTATSALVIGAASLGFLALNWPPARVFLGDVGSVPLGHLLAWLLVTLAAWGYWTAALILPAYYLADATITIARRALRGDRVWTAHAEHFYQRAVRRGFSHGEVTRLVLAGNVMLAILAVLSTQVMTAAGDALCLAGAGALVAVMLAWLARAEAPVRAAR